MRSANIADAGEDESAFDEGALREILASLDLPPEAVGPWLAHVRAFCDAHGGRRVYGDLLALLDRCEQETR